MQSHGDYRSLLRRRRRLRLALRWRAEIILAGVAALLWVRFRWLIGHHPRAAIVLFRVQDLPRGTCKPRAARAGGRRHSRKVRSFGAPGLRDRPPTRRYAAITKRRRPSRKLCSILPMTCSGVPKTWVRQTAGNLFRRIAPPLILWRKAGSWRPRVCR